jgi:hypothetical protein
MAPSRALARLTRHTLQHHPYLSVRHLARARAHTRSTFTLSTLNMSEAGTSSDPNDDRTSVRTKTMLEEAFATFDTNVNGTLSAAEMMGILMRTSGGLPLSMKDARAIVAEFDVNGDGQLDIAEFTRAFSGEVGTLGLMHAHKGKSGRSMSLVAPDHDRRIGNARAAPSSKQILAQQQKAAATKVQAVERGRVVRARRASVG